MAKPIVIDTDILIDFGLDREDAVETMAILEKKIPVNNKCHYSDGVVFRLQK